MNLRTYLVVAGVLLGLVATADVWAWRLGGRSRLPVASGPREAVQRSRSIPAGTLAVGKVLVAAQALTDPNFRETVVLLIAYSTEGAAGLVLNRRADVTVGRVFADTDAADDLSAPAFIGGPVAPSGVSALLRTTTKRAGTDPVLGDVQRLSTRDALREAITNGAEPDRLRVYLGYAGWDSGQLERELERSAWHVFDGTANLAFDRDPITLWRRMIRRTETQSVQLRRSGL